MLCFAFSGRDCGISFPSCSHSQRNLLCQGQGSVGKRHSPGPQPGLTPRGSPARPRRDQRLISCQGALRLTSSFRVRRLRGQGEFMAGFSEGGQRLGRARRSWPRKVIHELLHLPSGPAASTGPAGRPQPLRDRKPGSLTGWWALAQGPKTPAGPSCLLSPPKRGSGSSSPQVRSYQKAKGKTSGSHY